MQTITMTELRTKPTELIRALRDGMVVDLIHRSKILGKVSPIEKFTFKKIDSFILQKKMDKLNLPKLTLSEIDRKYKNVMVKKHGQGLS